VQRKPQNQSSIYQSAQIPKKVLITINLVCLIPINTFAQRLATKGSGLDISAALGFKALPFVSLSEE